MELVYGRSVSERTRGKAFRNARFFTKPEAGATKVLLDGDFPAIASAYEKAGVPVVYLRDEAILAVKNPLPPAADDDTIPDDWRDLPWPQLRRLASRVGEATIINKAEAVAAIEAHLDQGS